MTLLKWFGWIWGRGLIILRIASGLHWRGVCLILVDFDRIQQPITLTITRFLRCPSNSA